MRCYSVPRGRYILEDSLPILLPADRARGVGDRIGSDKEEGSGEARADPLIVPHAATAATA